VYTYLIADYDILQGIQHEIANLPIASSVEWVKGHQDRHKPWSKLSIEAIVNCCFAEDVCTDTHHHLPRDVGRFPDWVPGTRAALLHKGKLVSKKQDEYMTTAATAPRLRKCLMTEITQPCVHTCNGLFICQLYSLPNLLEETDCNEDTPLTLPFCIVCFLLTVDNSDMN
jgi:hypothetical protein